MKKRIEFTVYIFIFLLVSCGNESEPEKKKTRIVKDTAILPPSVSLVTKKNVIKWKDEVYGKKNPQSFHNTNQLSLIIKALAPLHTKMGKPRPSDWLARNKERGQSFQQYLSDKPIKLDQIRNKIYLLPLGDFDKTDKELLTALAEYLALYFEIEVILQAPQSLQIIPEGAFRRKNNDYPGNPQYLTSHILHKILLPQLPSNALAYMAITNQDLYPQPSWNFVFGQASTQKRVGVSSYFRYLQEEKPIFSQTLRRIIATSSHEIGHILTLYHCKEYECVMNGSNSLEESDRRPIYPCPECIAKLSWNIGFQIPQHYEKMSDFFQKYQLKPEFDYCKKVKNLGL